MSATSRLSRLGIAGRGLGGALKLGGADSPMVELSQSLSDMPARRAAASALSRTDGSMPSTLHDTREFMLSSGSAPALHQRHQPLPARPTEETIEFSRGSPASELTFSRYGKERVKEWDGRPQKLPAGQIGFGFKAFSGESLPPDLIRGGGRFASRKRVKLGIRRRFRFDRNGKALAAIFALAVFEGHDVGPLRAAGRQGGQRLDRLFAPLRHGALVGEADAKSEQLADIGRRRDALGETFVEQALVAGETVAVMFQPRHQVGAQRFDVDAVERVEPHQKVVLDRGWNARPGGPMPERGPPFRRECIDQ